MSRLIDADKAIEIVRNRGIAHLAKRTSPIMKGVDTLWLLKQNVYQLRMRLWGVFL